MSNCLMQQMKARLTHRLEPGSTVLASVTSSCAASEKVWMPLRSQGTACQHIQLQNSSAQSLIYSSCEGLRYLAISLCHLMDVSKTNHILISCEEFCPVFVLICNHNQAIKRLDNIPGWNGYQDTKFEGSSLPGIALIDNSVSARCCHLLQKEFDRTVLGNVITATELDEHTMAFSDLINWIMSQFCKWRSNDLEVATAPKCR